MHCIKKAVFPVAGFGTRFLPVTKANPKEMLPIVDKPLIQYAVEEAVRAGIDDIIFVTSSSKRAIEDHFDRNFELEMRLQEQNKSQLLDIVRHVSPKNVKFTYIRQNQPLGLGHAILCAAHVVGNSPFAVLLADDLIDDSVLPCLKDMTEKFTQYGQSIIAVQSVPWEDVHRYGVIKIAALLETLASIQDIIEKPDLAVAPSNFAAIGRYIFTPEIFSCLQQTSADISGEIQLTSGIRHLLALETVQAYRFHGKRYDCGSKLGYLQAVVDMGRQHLEVGQAFCNYLQNLQIT